ncbi:MAG: A/G-specific adenine glycosylase [Thermoguttaceae bacterium]|nr:A/G-specific adenine glycosylase [Thermoguttaceae bacterium]
MMFADLRRCLFRWFEENGRALPWRRDHPDAYSVWVSEIMLQQTTTRTVRDYFIRFTARFPDVRSLAAAEVSEVLQYWEGLGYYRRCHQLHAAARKIVEDFQGVFPDQRDLLLKLPGIGRYTAGAILSIAFDQRQPILEANTIRLHSRILGLRGDPARSAVNQVLWNFAEKILPDKNCGKFNQGLMDLGSLVCTPVHPDCINCPVVLFCQAARDGTQSFIPYIRPKQEKESRVEVALLVADDSVGIQGGDNWPECPATAKMKAAENRMNRQNSGVKRLKPESRFLLIKYPRGVRWAGLWDFPRFLQKSDGMPEHDATLNARLNRLLEFLARREGKQGRRRKVGIVLKELRHSVTRFRILLRFCETFADTEPVSADGPNRNFSVSVPRRKKKETNPEGLEVSLKKQESIPKKPELLKDFNEESKSLEFASGVVDLETLEYGWFAWEELASLPLSSTGRKLVRLPEEYPLFESF